MGTAPSPWVISSSGVHLLWIPFLTSCNVNLENKMASDFISKMSLFRKSTGIAIHHMQTVVMRKQIQKTEQCSFVEKEGELGGAI